MVDGQTIGMVNVLVNHSININHINYVITYIVDGMIDEIIGI